MMPFARIVAFSLGVFVVSTLWGANGELTFKLSDQKTGEPLSSRVVFEKADGKPLKIPRQVPDGMGFALGPETLLKLADGTYHFHVYRGPEYRIVHGTFELTKDAVGTEELPLERFVDMADEGWISGDLCVDQPQKVLPQLLAAEDLHAIVTPQAPKAAAGGAGAEVPAADRSEPTFIRSDAMQDPKHPGLLILGVPNLAPLEAKQPSSAWIRIAAERDAEGVYVLDPTDWDLPIWLASGQIKGIAVLHPEVRLDRPGKIRGRAPSESGFLNTTGPGRWADYVWRMAMEAGLRIPAIAASGAAAQGNPVGYNRVYVHCGKADDPVAFWEGLKSGRSIITNGPLMRPRLGGALPGETFAFSGGRTVELAPEMRLAVRDPVSYMEVLYNNQVIYSARLDEVAERGAEIPLLKFDASGWAVMRVVTQVDDHWRAAVSNPWWFEFGGTPRISRKACDFFQAWLDERATMLAKGDSESIAAAAPYVRAARAFWQQRRESATVD